MIEIPLAGARLPARCGPCGARIAVLASAQYTTCPSCEEILGRDPAGGAGGVWARDWRFADYYVDDDYWPFWFDESPLILEQS